VCVNSSRSMSWSRVKVAVFRGVSSCSSLGWPCLYLGGGTRILDDIIHDQVSGVI